MVVAHSTLLGKMPGHTLKVGREFQGPGHRQNGLGVCGLWVGTAPWPGLLIPLGRPHRRNRAGPMKCKAPVRGPFCLGLKDVYLKPVASICCFPPLAWMHGMGNHRVKKKLGPSLFSIIDCLNNFYFPSFMILHL